MARVSCEEWLALRVWRCLEVPADVGCRAACTAWSHAADRRGAAECRSNAEQERSEAQWSGAPRGARLRLPHLAVPDGAAGEAALRWALTHVTPVALESLRLPPWTPPRGAGTTQKDLDRSGKSTKSSALCRLAAHGATEWVTWLLAAEPRQEQIPSSGSSSSCSGCGSSRGCQCLRLAAPSTGQQAGIPPPPPFDALRTAAGAGHAEVIRVLLRARADVCGADENECTALHWAADKGQAEACSVLLAGGGEVDAQDDDDWTPLCLAAEDGHLEVCKVLLQARANANLPDEDLRSPLWWAAWRRHRDLVDLLLECEADPEQGDQSGITPQGLLLNAAAGGHFGTSRSPVAATR